MNLCGCLKQCKCKTNKYMYMVSHHSVKQCNRYDFFFSMGGFHNAFGYRPTKWLIAKKKKIKTFVFWNAPQLINMIHNKYLSSCKRLGRKWC